jgi:hypothetical protein
VEPRIQYARTSNGVNIAFLTLGEDPALVMTSPLIFSNVAAE